MPAAPLQPPPACLPAEAVRGWSAGSAPLLTLPAVQAAGGASHSGSGSESGNGDYRQQLKRTPAGWPTLPGWCVWIEPAGASGPAAQWEQRWRRAVTAATASWQREMPLAVVTDPAAAQVLVHRRRPPILNNRASHGRALLQLLEVRRNGSWRLEPRVDVLISPGQAEAAMRATALHELGHAFGLWGHSDRPDDAMAVSPGATPVLELSRRDRATLQWLRSQPGLQQGEGRPSAP